MLFLEITFWSSAFSSSIDVWGANRMKLIFPSLLSLEKSHPWDMASFRVSTMSGSNEQYRPFSLKRVAPFQRNCNKNVDFPEPGPPTIRLSEFRTNPPLQRLSNPAIPVGHLSKLSPAMLYTIYKSL